MENQQKTWEEMTAREAAQALAERKSLRQRSYRQTVENPLSEKYLAELRRADEESRRRWTAAEVERYAIGRFEKLTGRKPEGRYLELVGLLARYFAGEDGRLKPNKGIILSGCTGCGKTTLFKLFYFAGTRATEDNVRLFSWRSCRDIAIEYADPVNGGVQSLKRHFAGSALFDDLGAENISSHYGNRADVMGEIIQSRYDRKALTFFTTNLTYAQIRREYKERVASRLAEMCYWVDIGINEDYRK